MVERYFLLDDSFREERNMLSRKFAALEQEKGLYPMDDVAVVRLMKEH